MAPSRHQRPVVLDQLVDLEPQIHRGDNEGIQTLHGWVECLPFAGQFLPICVCGHHGPFVVSRDAMFDLVCERQELERVSAARRAVVTV